MSDVYISYARQEGSRAELLAHALEEAGISVWWDRQIPVGQTWADLIERELDSAGCVIVLWSANSVKSRWVLDEAAYARDMNKLVPVLIDDVQLPSGFSALQSAVLTDWNGEQSHPNFDHLLKTVSNLVERSRSQRRL